MNPQPPFKIISTSLSWMRNLLGRLNLGAGNCIFSLYAATGSAVLAFSSNWLAARTIEVCKKHSLPSVYMGCDNPYPPSEFSSQTAFLYWVTALALYLADRTLIRRSFPRTSPRWRYPLFCGVFAFVTYVLAGIAAGILTGVTTIERPIDGAISWWVLYGVTFGIIDVLIQTDASLAFARNENLSTTVKLARLQHEHDLWLTVLSLLTAIYVSIAISGIIAVVLAVHETLRGIWVFIYLVLLSYGTLGWIFGVYFSIALRIGKINATVLLVKS